MIFRLPGLDTRRNGELLMFRHESGLHLSGAKINPLLAILNRKSYHRQPIEMTHELDCGADLKNGGSLPRENKKIDGTSFLSLSLR